VETTTTKQKSKGGFFTDNRLVKVFRLTGQAFAGYRNKIIVLLGLGFLGGLLEGIGITAIIPLFSFLAEDGEASANIITKTTKSMFEILHIPFALNYVLIFIALLFILKAVATFFSRYITEIISSSYIKETQVRLLDHTLNASWSYLSKQRLGHLEKVLSYDIRAGAVLLTLTTSMVILAVNIIIYSTIALNISSIITIITLSAGGVMFFVFKPLVRRSRATAQKSGAIMKDGANLINESMTGIKTVKAMSIEDKIANKAQNIFEKWKELTIRIATLSNFTNSAMQPIAVLLVLTLFAFSHATSGFTFATFAVIIYAINKIFAYIQQGQGQLHTLNEHYPFLKTVMEYEEEAKMHEEKDVGDALFKFNNAITFEDVSFSYHKKDPALKNIQLTITKGEITGIIGPSGSGKTTVVDLLLRLIEPESGKILLDNTDIREIDIKEWRKNIGYVSQDIFLINDTIRNNITFYSEDISNEDIERATKMANIHSFIETLDEGLDTMIGERGTRLSGGQRQRIVLARILARNPEILVLDEATSALDNESQALILETIENLRGKITVIIIAHRTSTVRNTDHLAVISESRIVETGKPDEMLKNKDSYFYRINKE
jgi:ABC-type multidrug transport system fused ATPase/permease subunit